MAWGVALSAGIALAAALAYALVARAVARRAVGPASAWANASYACGWAGLSVMLMTDAGRLATGLAPPPSPEMYLVLVQLKIVATAFALFGFGAYVGFLHTGRKTWSLAPPLAVGFVYAYFFLAITHARLPMTIEVGTWSTRLQLQPGSIFPGGEAVGITLFFLPLIVVVFLYLSLWRRLATRVQHLRLLAVAASLLVFLVAASVQSNPGASPDAAVLPLMLVVMLATGLFSLAAFQPPKWLDRRLRAPASAV